MATFSDDFNRANGPLGAGWTVLAGAPVIEANGLRLNAGSQIRPASFSATGNVSMSVDYTYNDANNRVLRLFLGWNDGGGVCHAVSISSTTGTSTFTLNRVNGVSWTELDSYTVAGAIPIPSTFLFEKTGTTYSFKLNGAEVMSATDANADAGGLVRLEGSNFDQALDNFSVTGGDPPYLTIAPSEVYAANPASYLSVTLHNAEWAGPFPATGNLSVNHGWLITQYRESATLASFSYQAMGYVGVVTVTDGDTGATGTFTTRPYPVSEGDSGFPLDQCGANVINNAGDLDCDTRVLTTAEPIDDEGTVNIPTGIDAIIEQLGGYPGQVGPDIGAVSLPALLYALYEKPNPLEHYTINDILGSLGGSPTVYSHKDILNAVNPIRTTDLPAIQTYLEAMRGNDVVTVLQIVTALTNIQTGNGYTLGSVMDAIAALAPINLDDVMHKLGHIQPDEADTLSTLAAALASINTIVSGISTSLGAYRTGANYTVQSILDRLDDLEAKIDALPTSGAPVWPGAGSVTLGTPVAYSDNLSIVAPMDGVIVAWTSPPSKTGHYVLGNEHYYYGSGRIAFGTDSGDLEPPQWLGFTSAIYTPQNMQRASAVRFQGVGGAVGTVTPWTRS